MEKFRYSVIDCDNSKVEVPKEIKYCNYSPLLNTLAELLSSMWESLGVGF